MARKPVVPEAKEALNQMKYEIASELGLYNDENIDRSNVTARDNGLFGGYVGGNMTKRLIEQAQRQLVEKK